MDNINILQNIPTSWSCNNFSHLPVREGIMMRINRMHYQLVECNNWKPIQGHEDYIINENGVVKHLKSYGNKPHLLVATLRNNKYFYITLTKNGKRIGHPIDKLVASTFLDIPIDKIRRIIHRDGIKHNNTISNLLCVERESN